MRKEEIFEAVLSAVSDITGVERTGVLNGRCEECTDARYLLVRAMGMLDFTDSDVAGAIGCTRQAIVYMRNHYKKGGKWTIANHWQAIRKWVENNYLCSQ